MPYDPEDDDEDQPANFLTYGNRGASDDEDQEAQPLSPYLTGVSNSSPADDQALAPEQAPQTSAQTQNPDTAVQQQPQQAELTPPTYTPTPLSKPPVFNPQDWENPLHTLATAPPSHTDPNLKPRWYERLAGGVGAGLMGFGHDPNAVAAGEAVVNRRYNNAVADYDKTQGNARENITALNDRDTAAGRSWERELQAQNAGREVFNTQDQAYARGVTARDHAAQEQQRLQQVAPGTEQPDDPKNPMGTWHAMTVGGKPIALNSPPDSWLKTPQGKQMAETARRQQLVKDNNLQGDEAKYVMVNGKLREPASSVRVTNEPQGAREWDAYVKALGHPPTTADVLNYKRNNGGGQSAANKNLMDRIEAQKNTAINKARDDYAKGLSTFDDYMNDWQSAQDDYEERLGTATGGDIPHVDIRSNVDAQGNWKGGGQSKQPQQQAQPQAQAQPQSQAQPQQQQPAQLPRGGGKPLDANTAKQFLQAAGGDKNKARQLATKNGWKF
jgi:hypothetical protein